MVNEYLGDYDSNRRIFLSPELQFEVDLNLVYDHLESLITRNEFEFIKNNLDKFNHVLHKNPACIILGFIAYKNDINFLRNMLKNYAIIPILQEWNINMYDIIRYMRYYQIHMKNIIPNY